MSKICSNVVFSNKAYNAIIRESFSKDPVETGGILLGHIGPEGIWVVMEVLPPGIKSIFKVAYFEYDMAFVNYLGQSVANMYKKPLEVLGLWHRHPGRMDVFSSTDDETNTTFARMRPEGTISGLVNIDPAFRFTLYHLDQSRINGGRPEYEVVDFMVGDDIIPPEYFELKYINSPESNLHPVPQTKSYNFGNSCYTENHSVIHSERNDSASSVDASVDIGSVNPTNRDILDEILKKKQCSKGKYTQWDYIYELMREHTLISILIIILVCWGMVSLCKGCYIFFKESRCIEMPVQPRNPTVEENFYDGAIPNQEDSDPVKDKKAVDDGANDKETKQEGENTHQEESQTTGIDNKDQSSDKQNSGNNSNMSEVEKTGKK